MPMNDRETAVARLLRIADREQAWMEEIGLPDASSIGAVLREVAEMLREQEPVEPNKPGTAYKTVWSCGVCAYPISTDWVACPSCGKAVKWDGD